MLNHKEMQSIEHETDYKISFHKPLKNSLSNPMTKNSVKGTASDQLPIKTGRINPKTKNNQIADPNAQKTCLPIFSWAARK